MNDKNNQDVLALALSLNRSLNTVISDVSEVAAADIQALGSAITNFSTLLESGSDSRHDLRNAISAVKGYCELICEENDPALRPFLSDIQSLIALLDPELAPPEQTEQSGALTSDMSDTTALVVDDMQENIDLMTRMLTKAGCTVLSAISGEDALKILSDTEPDIILLDLMMPGMSGHDVLVHIKSDEDLRAIPVIMVSGRQDMDQIISSIQSGADDYLIKPINSVLLNARLVAGIERKRWHDKEELYRDQLEQREQFIRDTFGRYISDAIVDELLEQPEGLKLGGDLKTVTIMMSDIRGFTTLSESLDPEAVVSLLNRYLGRMTDIILRHGGTIDEFLGDAVLAAFGAPKSSGTDALDAMRCALEMQSAMADINAANKSDNLPELQMAIALNTGDVVAGNIGSERRSKYGFVGHPVNVTSRIEDDAKPGEILVSQSTRAAGSTATFRFGESRSLQPKGIAETLEVYPLLGEVSDE